MQQELKINGYQELLCLLQKASDWRQVKFLILSSLKWLQDIVLERIVTELLLISIFMTAYQAVPDIQKALKILFCKSLITQLNYYQIAIVKMLVITVLSIIAIKAYTEFWIEMRHWIYFIGE